MVPADERAGRARQQGFLTLAEDGYRLQDSWRAGTHPEVKFRHSVKLI